MAGLCGYHADAEDGEEQEPGQVCAAPVLQRSPFSLCPLKHTHNTVTPRAEPGLQNRAEPRLFRPVSSARLGFSADHITHSFTLSRSSGPVVYQEQWTGRSRSQEQLIGLQPLALIPARPSLLPGSCFPFTVKK